MSQNSSQAMKGMLSALGMGDLADRPPACFYCKKTEPSNATPDQKLKRCSRCHIALYCSHECQKAHWKLGHKTQCSLGALANNIYLESIRSEEEAMDQLIDAYRLRVEDDYAFAGNNHGLYAMEDPYPDFKSFLDLAESKTGILPKWWNEEKRKICERRALNRDGWSCIAFAVEKPDIQEHYDDSMMPMKLRMLAEMVYGRGIY
jgi:splicing suppressor protein 51